MKCNIYKIYFLYDIIYYSFIIQVCACLYLLDGAVEGGVEVCRTHVVLECELPAAVLSQIKPAESITRMKPRYKWRHI